MKPVSNKFKEAIKQYGRQIDTIITYTDSEGEHLLDGNVLFSVTQATNGNILKSVMKQLDFESTIRVPKDTVINVKFGVEIDLSGNLKEFEYINLGNYIVSKEPEYNADTFSYNHVCYDKMLYSMKNYQKLNTKLQNILKNLE